MAKEKKAKPAAKKTEIPFEEKKALKAKLKSLKAEKDAAITEKDKKKVKAARTKAKKVNLKLKRVKATPPAPAPKAEKKEEAAG